MRSASAASSATGVDFVNPVIRGTCDVFRMMLNCAPRRTGVVLKGQPAPACELSAVISLTGSGIVGTLVLNLRKSVAVEILKAMAGIEAPAFDKRVCDAIGELTNMIAGATKSQLPHWNLSLSLPNVVSGEALTVHYPADVQPVCLLFDSELGPFAVEIGFTSRDGHSEEVS